MKNLQIISCALFAILFFASCSSDNDDGGNNNNGPITGNYMPSTVSDLWTYNVEETNSNDTNLNFTDTDFISVATSTGNGFTLVANNNNSPASGTMNAILVNGTLSRDDTTLKLSGDLELPSEFSDFSSTTISLQDVMIYDLNASNNSTLSEVTGSFTQDLDLEGNILPLTVTYTLTTKKISNMNSLTVDGEVFSNVFKGELNISMNVITSIDLLGLGNPADYDVLATQDVLTIENYFAKDVGLIKSESYITYQLDQGLLAVLANLQLDLGIPENLTVENTQEIENYLISE